jgi:hypothetical protein
MPAVLELRTCAACKGRHTLSLPRGDTPDPNGKYFYQCAASGISVRLTGNGVWKPADVKPLGAIDLHEMK